MASEPVQPRLLQITDLSFQYPNSRETALQRINLDIKQGDIVGLLGVNGAGKTTLVSLIAGLLKPGGGEILIADSIARAGRKDLALVPQEFAFYDKLSAHENLAYFAGILGIQKPAADIQQLLERCKLVDIAQRPSHSYSGGEKRRLNFAIALLRPASLLILDEPTANVDPHSRALILDLVREQNAAGTTIIYTSHLLSEVQQLCNTLALVHQGEIKISGSLSNLLDPNTAPISLSFHPADADKLCRLPAVFQVEGLQAETPAGAISLAQVLQVLHELQLQPASIHAGQASLESLFMQLTDDLNLRAES